MKHKLYLVLASLLASLFLVLPASAATPAALPDTPDTPTIEVVDLAPVPPYAHPNYVLALPVAPEVDGPVTMDLVPVQPEQFQIQASEQITQELISTAQVEVLVNQVFYYASIVLGALLTIVAVGAGLKLAFRLADKIANMF